VREFQLPRPAQRDSATRIVIGKSARQQLAQLVDDTFGGAPWALCADGHVLQLWYDDLAVEPPLGFFPLPPGEAAKSFAVVESLLEEFTRVGVGRDACIVTLGGGAAGDAAGLAAALHLRGIATANVPTSLLSMVDASLGGKCAVNLATGKNLAGTFWNPALVVIDPDFLETLAEVEFRSGLGEIAKYALGFSQPLADSLQQGVGDLAAVIETCVGIKADIVIADPYETSGTRARLNLGHTTAHALEAWAADDEVLVPHGLAVGLGLRVACNLALEEGRLSQDEHSSANALLDRHQLPATLSDLIAKPPPAAELTPFLGRDKKIIAGELRVVLPNGIGASEVTTIDASRFAQAIANC
jgi:3-dehydroquinate synthase